MPPRTDDGGKSVEERASASGFPGGGLGGWRLTSPFRSHVEVQITVVVSHKEEFDTKVIHFG